MGSHRRAVRPRGDHAARARLRSLALPTAERRSARPPCTAGPRRRRGVGCRHRSRCGVRRSASVRGLRRLPACTTPWFFSNDSTYQAELGGELVLDLENPYGHDYRRSGLERFYTRDGSVSEHVREREVALRHFAYFPGAVISAAVWRLLPEPFDDYRLLVLLATLALLPAVLLFHGPPAPWPAKTGDWGVGWRLALGAVLVCNPIAVRSAWFGQNDA